MTKIETVAAGLTVDFQPIESLRASDRRELRSLMCRWFENVTQLQFEKDLDEKDWIVVAREAGSGRIGGFSTLCTIEAEVAQTPVNAIYSGDTVVEPQWWTSLEFFKGWTKCILHVAERLPLQPAYWLLLSSGFRTYRLLPTFFRNYLPRYDGASPEELRATLEVLALAKFGDRFDPVTGIVRLAHPTPLRTGISEITEARLNNPHVRFFVERNPGHHLGDELVCLTELAVSNCTPAARRILG